MGYDYTVFFSLVRNPYVWVGSSYDYILCRHEVRPFGMSSMLQRQDVITKSPMRGS